MPAFLSSIYFGLLLGHLVGDYLCQNTWMAVNKIRNDHTGWLACFVHSLVYTIAVASTVGWVSGCWAFFDPIGMFLLFNTHFWIDKFSLGNLWLKMVKDVDLKAVLSSGYNGQVVDTASKISLTWFLYIVIDNTLHLVLMTALVRHLL